MAKAETKKPESVTPEITAPSQTHDDRQYQEWLEYMNTIGVRGPGMIKERACEDE